MCSAHTSGGIMRRILRRSRQWMAEATPASATARRAARSELHESDPRDPSPGCAADPELSHTGVGGRHVAAPVLTGGGADQRRHVPNGRGGGSGIESRNRRRGGPAYSGRGSTLIVAVAVAVPPLPSRTS